MSNKKKRSILINKMVNASFKNLRLQENTVKKYAKILDLLPKLQKMLILKSYIRGLKKYIEDRSLIVESSVELDYKELVFIKGIFAKKFEILDLKTLINEDLLGGIKIKVADFIFDDSVKIRIFNLKGVLSA